MQLLLLDNTTCKAKARYTEALKKKLRRFDVQFVVVSAHDPVKVQQVVRSMPLDGAILSGSSKSFSDNSVTTAQLTSNNIVLTHVQPVLGICFGMQAMVFLRGGRIAPLTHAVNTVDAVEFTENSVFSKHTDSVSVKRHHKDVAIVLPKGFRAVARDTTTWNIMAFAADNDDMFGVQFHPEALDNVENDNVLKAFLAKCRAKRDPGLGPGSPVGQPGTGRLTDEQTKRFMLLCLVCVAAASMYNCCHRRHGKIK